MKIALASDHAGYEYKQAIKAALVTQGHDVIDFGPKVLDPTDDYPAFIRPAAEAVARGDCQRGIVLGGSGNGEAIAANKVKGIRCALAWNTESATLSRRHNDANVLSLGQRMIPLALALEIVQAWLTTPFEAGRHSNRIDQITAIESA